MSIFLPGAPAAGKLGADLDRRLLDSLFHIAEACDVDEAVISGLHHIGEGLGRGGRASPGHYGIHFDLLDAIADGAREQIDLLFALLALLPVSDSQAITCCHPEDVPQPLVDIYCRNLDADPSRPINLEPYDPGRECRARGDLAEALDLISSVHPELAGEIGRLVREFVLIDSAPSSANPFFAASTFHLWGGVFIAPHRHQGSLDLAETIVHEAAHIYLAGVTAEAPALLNDRDSRYRSPLRTDPRPMEGVFHATFVLAREILFHRAVAQANDLPEGLCCRSEQAVARKTEAFHDGLSVVRAHGELTALGRSLTDDAATFVTGDSAG